MTHGDFVWKLENIARAQSQLKNMNIIDKFFTEIINELLLLHEDIQRVEEIYPIMETMDKLNENGLMDYDPWNRRKYNRFADSIFYDDEPKFDLSNDYDLIYDAEKKELSYYVNDALSTENIVIRVSKDGKVQVVVNYSGISNSKSDRKVYNQYEDAIKELIKECTTDYINSFVDTYIGFNKDCVTECFEIALNVMSEYLDCAYDMFAENMNN